MYIFLFYDSNYATDFVTISSQPILMKFAHSFGFYNNTI